MTGNRHIHKGAIVVKKKKCVRRILLNMHLIERDEDDGEKGEL